MERRLTAQDRRTGPAQGPAATPEPASAGLPHPWPSAGTPRVGDLTPGGKGPPADGPARQGGQRHHLAGGALSRPPAPRAGLGERSSPQCVGTQADLRHPWRGGRTDGPADGHVDEPPRPGDIAGVLDGDLPNGQPTVLHQRAVGGPQLPDDRHRAQARVGKPRTHRRRRSVADAYPGGGPESRGHDGAGAGRAAPRGRAAPVHLAGEGRPLAGRGRKTPTLRQQEVDGQRVCPSDSGGTAVGRSTRPDPTTSEAPIADPSLQGPYPEGSVGRCPPSTPSSSAKTGSASTTSPPTP